MHKTVLLDEFIEIVKKLKNLKTGLDVTYGGGGHSRVLEKLGINVIKIDKDSSIKEVIHDSYKNIDLYLKEKVDITIADLGISNMQIERFTYKKNNILDLRMNPNPYPEISTKKIIKNNNIFPFFEVLKFLQESELSSILKKYGELKEHRLLANKIFKYQLKKEIKTSFDLLEAINITDYKKLSQIFQAFRIYTNNELFELEEFCKKIKKLTRYLIILTFHSLEDKIIKKYFKKDPIIMRTTPIRVNLYFLEFKL